MPIPKLLQFEGTSVSLNQKFINFNEFINWSPERQIEVLYKLVIDSIYGNSEFSEEKIEKSMQAFNGAYGLAKLKFQDIERNTGGRYFDHLINVMQFTVLNSKNPTIKKTIIAMCHDMIEDTDISFSTLKDIFGTHIALGVLLISKSPIREYINNKGSIDLSEYEKEFVINSGIISYGKHLSKKYLEKKYNNPNEVTPEELEAERLFLESKNDFELFEMIENTGILNSKGLISDEYYQKETYEPEKITPEERWAKERYEKINKKYKDLRNADYFSHMLSEKSTDCENGKEKIGKNTHCLNKFYNHALSITMSPNLRIKLSDDELRQVCLDSIEVKFWDRIDNLMTTEIYTTFSEENIEKAKRKIEETKKYFYMIAKEFDDRMGTNFYLLISNEVEKLEEFIKEIERDSNFHELYLSIKDGVEKIIK